MYILKINVGGDAHLYLKEGDCSNGVPHGRCIAELNLHALRRHTSSSTEKDMETARLFCKAENVSKAASKLLVAVGDGDADLIDLAKAELQWALDMKVDMVEYYYHDLDSACVSKKINGVSVPTPSEVHGWEQ